MITMPPRKNPNRPKGKMTGYAFFVNACRLEHHNQFPGQKIKLSEFSTVCAKRWKDMSIEQKRPFAEMADRDKMRYDNELKLLYPGEPQPKRRRKKKDPNAPKKNLSPFFIFSKMKRPEIMKDHPAKGVGQISKVLSGFWTAMSEEEKNPYIKLSEEDKIRYQKDMEIFKVSGTIPTHPPAHAALAEDEDEDGVEEDEEDVEDEEDDPHTGQPTVPQPPSAGIMQQQQADLIAYAQMQHAAAQAAQHQHAAQQHAAAQQQQQQRSMGMPQRMEMGAMGGHQPDVTQAGMMMQQQHPVMMSAVTSAAMQQPQMQSHMTGE